MSIAKKIYINRHFNAIIVLGCGSMGRRRKRKLKKKVKKFLIMFLITTIIIIISTATYKNISKKSPSKEKTIVIKKNTSFKDKIKKECKKISYCNNKYIDRYYKYYKNNKKLSINDIITRVNLGLDYDFYTHTRKAKDLNKDYILVNKYSYLEEDYIPNNLEIIPEEYARSGMRLVKNAKDAFVAMAREARKDKRPIIAMSSYRSYKYQVNLFEKYKEADGIKDADTYSARAGFSEHQTGLCVDIYDGVLDYTNFEQSDSFDWMQKNAYKYGFILRFPEGKENITGYQYESWHYRYVGKDIAKYIHNNDITFEEYYIQKIDKNN